MLGGDIAVYGLLFWNIAIGKTLLRFARHLFDGFHYVCRAGYHVTAPWARYATTPFRHYSLLSPPPVITPLRPAMLRWKLPLHIEPLMTLLALFARLGWLITPPHITIEDITPRLIITGVGPFSCRHATPGAVYHITGFHHYNVAIITADMISRWDITFSFRLPYILFAARRWGGCPSRRRQRRH